MAILIDDTMFIPQKREKKCQTLIFLSTGTMIYIEGKNQSFSLNSLFMKFQHKAFTKIMKFVRDYISECFTLKYVVSYKCYNSDKGFIPDCHK